MNLARRITDGLIAWRAEHGSRLRAYRALQGISLKAAARLLGTSPGFIFSAENGERTMPEEWIVRLPKVIRAQILEEQMLMLRNEIERLSKML